MNDSTPKLAVVFGATGGIGQAIAGRLSSMGYNLLLIGRDEHKLEGLRSRLGHVRTNFVLGDMSTEEGIRSLTRSVEPECSSIGLLVHAAGVFARASVESTNPDQVRELWIVNALAPFMLTVALAPLLRKNQADVVFINSSIVQRPVPDLSAYSASKTALKSFADTLRAELNPDGVRVIGLYPGRTQTPMQEKISVLEKSKYTPELLVQPDSIAELLVSIVNLPRTVEVTDVYLRPTTKS